MPQNKMCETAGILKSMLPGRGNSQVNSFLIHFVQKKEPSRPKFCKFVVRNYLDNVQRCVAKQSIHTKYNSFQFRSV